MSDVIEKLFEVEREARQTIARAEKEAEQAVAEAEAEARRAAADERRKAQADAEELLTARARELAEQKQARLKDAAGRLPSADTIDPRRLGKAVEFVVNVIAYGRPERD